MQDIEQLPKGLRLLIGPKRSYEFMVSQMEECCDENPNCRHRTECKKRFEDYHFADPYKERKLAKEAIGKEPKQRTDAERYSTWMPGLNLKEIMRDVRASRIY